MFVETQQINFESAYSASSFWSIKNISQIVELCDDTEFCNNLALMASSISGLFGKSLNAMVHLAKVQNKSGQKYYGINAICIVASWTLNTTTSLELPSYCLDNDYIFTTVSSGVFRYIKDINNDSLAELLLKKFASLPSSPDNQSPSSKMPMVNYNSDSEDSVYQNTSSIGQAAGTFMAYDTTLEPQVSFEYGSALTVEEETVSSDISVSNEGTMSDSAITNLPLLATTPNNASESDALISCNIDKKERVLCKPFTNTNDHPQSLPAATCTVVSENTFCSENVDENCELLEFIIPVADTAVPDQDYTNKPVLVLKLSILILVIATAALLACLFQRRSCKSDEEARLGTRSELHVPEKPVQ